jgi:hypothetical protein
MYRRAKSGEKEQKEILWGYGSGVAANNETDRADGERLETPKPPYS